MVAIVSQIQENIRLEEFLLLSETKPYLEYLNYGEIRQKPMPQGEHSTIQIELASWINQLGKSAKLVYALPELRCTFGGKSIVPDISVFEWQRLPKTEEGKIANKFMINPDWVIEILSPEQSANQVINKIIFWLKQGTKLGWLIDSVDESVMIFYPNQLPEIKSGEDILPALDCISHGQLSVKQMFDWLKI